MYLLLFLSLNVLVEWTFSDWRDRNLSGLFKNISLCFLGEYKFYEFGIM